jgi:hypothetical protein
MTQRGLHRALIKFSAHAWIRTGQIEAEMSWVASGSRVQPTYRASILRSGSPPEDASLLTRAAIRDLFLPDLRVPGLDLGLRVTEIFRHCVGDTELAGSHPR